MVDLVKLLGNNPNAEAMMMEVYDFEEALAKVIVLAYRRSSI